MAITRFIDKDGNALVTYPKGRKPDYGYRGYTVRQGLLDDWFIGQGGHFSGCFRSEAAVRAAIDHLTEGEG